MISCNQTSSLLTDNNGRLLTDIDPTIGTSSLWMLSEYLAGPLYQLDHQMDYYLNDVWLKNSDERVAKLPFMADGPWKLLAAVSLYVYCILQLGPYFINSKTKPFELNWTIRTYNLMMIVSNCWAFYHGCRILNFGLSCFGCEIIDQKDNSPSGLELLRYGWLFFLSRIIEWLDTVFFVLRKKPSQITKLHIFHHAFVPLLVWVYLKFHPGKTVAFFPLVNSFVHTIMYSYYFLATFGPKIQPYLWWKKYLTSMQITQFVLILIQLATIPLSTSQECQYPRIFLYIAFAGACLFLYLFYSYYRNTYKPQPDNNEKRRLSNNSSSHQGEPIRRTPNGLSTKITTTKSQTNQQYQYCSQRTTTLDGSSKSLSDVIDDAIITHKEDFGINQQHHTLKHRIATNGKQSSSSK